MRSRSRGVKGEKEDEEEGGGGRRRRRRSTWSRTRRGSRESEEMK